MFAVYFKSWVETPAGSVHHGARLPKDGVAIDEEGNVFFQDVSDRGWWEWSWSPSGTSIRLPRQITMAFKELAARTAAAESAVSYHKEKSAAFRKVASEDPKTSWWPGGATPGDLTNKSEADKWEKTLSDAAETEMRAFELVAEAQDRLNRISKPLLVLC